MEPIIEFEIYAFKRCCGLGFSAKGGGVPKLPERPSDNVLKPSTRHFSSRRIHIENFENYYFLKKSISNKIIYDF